MTAGPRRRLRFGVEEITFTGRSLRHSVRNGEALLMSVMLPVLIMLMFTFVFGGAINPDGSYVNYVVPGIILLCAGFGAASTAVDVAQDMENGIMDRLRTMPIRSSAVLTGHVAASLVRNLAATVLVILVAAAVGFRPATGLLDWLTALALVALYILAITYLFAAIGLAANSAEAANGYGFILLFVPYLSSAFVPVASLPAWLRPIAESQPLTPIIESVRALLTGAQGERTQPLAALLWCLLILAVAVAWVTVMFRRKVGHN